MTLFVRLLSDDSKKDALVSAAGKFRAGLTDRRLIEVNSSTFQSVPSKAFAYWVSDSARLGFSRFPPLLADDRSARSGLGTGDDFRFVRAWWEISKNGDRRASWVPFAKGGAYSRYYADVYLVVNWADQGRELKAQNKSVIRNPDFYYKKGITWSDRTTKLFSARVWPAGGVFSVKGSAGFFPDDDIFFALGLLNSLGFNLYLSLMVGAAEGAARSYQVGVINSVPWPDRSSELASLAERGWLIRRELDKVDETTSVFELPLLSKKDGEKSHRDGLIKELKEIDSKIDSLSVELYGLEERDRGYIEPVDYYDSFIETEAQSLYRLFSWCVGVVYGRFSTELLGKTSSEVDSPDPFQEISGKSPGMLEGGEAPYCHHRGVMVDDSQNALDLPSKVEHILERVTPDNLNVRSYLQKIFFLNHLSEYSKSKRKAPIYWPLATASGSYTLWIYYPKLDDQTLYTAINDFLEPKLKLVGDERNSLWAKSNRSAAEESELEKQQDLEHELIELRDAILKIAPTYKPNHDDGVQITAAPLWPLFRHKPWQKVLKGTWEKLEAGEYDWAHLAYRYWPERVREKCKTDKSLAIAHGLEELYEEPAA